MSQSNFDFNHQFTNCSNCEGHSIDINKSTVLVREFKKLDLNGGRVSVGVLPCAPGEMSTQSCNSSVENVTVYVTSVSCRFWDKSQWKTEGCRVSSKFTNLTIKYVTINYVTTNYVTIYYVTTNYVTINCVTTNYVTINYVIINYVTVNYITINYVTINESKASDH